MRLELQVVESIMGDGYVFDLYEPEGACLDELDDFLEARYFDFRGRPWKLWFNVRTHESYYKRIGYGELSVLDKVELKLIFG